MPRNLLIENPPSFWVRQIIQNTRLSIDGFGATSNTGNLQIDIPVGSTIEKAYLYAFSRWDTTRLFPVTFRGVSLSLAQGILITELTRQNPVNLIVWDVTNIVQNFFTGGLQNFSILESGDNEGAVLVVAYSNSSTQGFTSIILDGQLKLGPQQSDFIQFNFASPYTGGDFLVSLASSFSFQPSGQFTRIDVTTNSTNNRRLTASAGGQDDGQGADGALITVGGIGDNPANVDPTTKPLDTNLDDEYYNLALGNSANPDPFILPGDTFLRLTAENPSNNDNVFGLFINSSFFVSLNE